MYTFSLKVDYCGTSAHFFPIEATFSGLQEAGSRRLAVGPSSLAETGHTTGGCHLPAAQFNQLISLNLV
jgi:hypothetical protein